MKKKKTFTTKMTNAVEPAAPMSVWGKCCAGKGGPSRNALIVRNNSNVKEND